MFYDFFEKCLFRRIYKKQVKNSCLRIYSHSAYIGIFSCPNCDDISGDYCINYKYLIIEVLILYVQVEKPLYSLYIKNYSDFRTLNLWRHHFNALYISNFILYNIILRTKIPMHEHYWHNSTQIYNKWSIWNCHIFEQIHNDMVC